MINVRTKIRDDSGKRKQITVSPALTDRFQVMDFDFRGLSAFLIKMGRWKQKP